MRREFPTKLRIAEGGRIVIPAAVREQLGLDIGSELVMVVGDDYATLMNARAARRRAQRRVRRYVAPGVRLSEDLMAERKKEARRG